LAHPSGRRSRIVRAALQPPGTLKGDIVSEATTLPPQRSPRQGIILRLVDLLSDNTTISDEDAAKAIGAEPSTVRHLRKSDSFRTLLARAIKVKHGEGLYAVEAQRIAATTAVLTAITQIATAPEVLPTVKLEAARIVLDDWNKTQDRIHAPKLSSNQQPATNVTVELTFNELQAARENQIARGKTLELEPSDVAHVPVNPFAQRGLLSSSNKTGAPVREEGE